MTAKPFNPSAIRIAAFDLDGTVLQGGYMSPGVKKALGALSARGIAVTVATGRDISQIPHEVLDCFSYRVTTNGATVTDKTGKELASHPMDLKTILETLAIIRKHGGASCVYYNGFLLASIGFLLRLIFKTDFASKGHRKSTKAVRNNGITFTLNRSVRKRNKDGFKITAFFRTTEKQLAALEDLQNAGKVNPIALEGNGMEITMANVTKAHGLLELCKRLNCNQENIISFGDSGNDIEMLRTSGYSVGMGNAEESVKSVVDYITDPVTEDGVATAIRNLFSL